MRSSPVRVALLVPYWNFFETSVAFDLRADRRALGTDLAARVAQVGVEVIGPELLDSRAASAEVAERVRAAGAEALVVALSMAVPPAFTLAALERLRELPLLVVALGRRGRFDASHSHADITAEGATVGVPQLTNVLQRQGRRHQVVVAPLDAVTDLPSVSELTRALRALTAAGRLRSARIARVGQPIDGYDCVDCDDSVLRAATGIELVDVEPAVVQEAYRAIAASAVEAVEAEARATFALADDVERDECLARSLRFAAALEALDVELEIDAGAMNCHVPEIRFAPEDPGITPCFALGRETSRGIPWSCAGDVLTAVALLTAKLLGGAAMYHEVEALDHAADEALLANSGEHDLALADPQERPTLVRNPWWAADPRCGACACFGPAPGPATLIAFTPHPDEPSGVRFIVAEGAFGARRMPHTGTTHAAFRFAGGEPIARAWGRWVAAGVNHHAAAAPGALGGVVVATAAHLGVGCVRVT